MAKYSKDTIDSVNKNADIREIIPDADPTRPRQQITCPFCGEKKKFSVTRNSRQNSAYCFVCKEGFANPISAWMYYQGYGKDKYPQAIEEVARLANMVIYSEEQKRENTIRDAGDNIKASFCEMQLAASGLEVADVMAKVTDGKSESLVSPFQPGSFGTGFRIDTKADDMVIYYYDLHGRPMTYTAKGSATPRQYVRVRYFNPDLHRIKDKPMKYQTPTGAPCRAYIPEYIRRRFQAKEHIDTLFLQEGEKKAEKACKHGMPSIGIQGINNIGTVETGLLQDIQDIVKVCTVRNVVLMMDSDWDDLHREITIGDRVDKRPNSFAAAVIKFKQFMASFHHSLIDVEAWWGHVNDNDAHDKGIDDLLHNTLKCHEDELIADAVHAMDASNGKGRYVTIVKVSTITDMKIRDFWNLNDHQAFFERHSDRLSSVASFRLGGVRYKVENGKMLAMSRYSSDVDIYSIEVNDKDVKKVSMNYTETFRFLAASGFYRLRNSSEGASGYDLIHIDDGIIDRAASYEVRDFVRQYIMSNTKDSMVHEYFNSRLDVLLPDKKLEGLPIIDDSFSVIEPHVQRTCYNNGQVEITSADISPEKPINNIWRSRIVPRNFQRVPLIKSIAPDDDGFSIDISQEAEKCEFLQYLINSSNNYYPHNAPRDLSDAENREWTQHIVNKLTAIGYLLADWKPANERKAVIIQDHLMSEVGQNHGGAGKTLVGNALSKIIPQTTISGSTFKKDDQFLFSGVTKATRNVFIDDVRPNFDFKTIYPMITGEMEINPKGKDRFQIPVEASPKFLITTNHTINGATENSTRRRIIYMEFSTWYNPDHMPIDDFHHMFFDDWDDYQWNLFDNLMAECVMYYFRSFEQQWYREGQGAVPPPMKQIQLRSLRQEMSEPFYQWADEYYDPSGPHLNEREPRQELFKTFIEYAGPAGHGVTRTNFLKKITAYCKFKGYDLNINRPDEHKCYYADWKPQHPDESFIGDNDKSGGKEFFTVYWPDKPPTDSSIHPI